MLSGVCSENVHLLEDTHWLHKLNTFNFFKGCNSKQEKIVVVLGGHFGDYTFWVDSL